MFSYSFPSRKEHQTGMSLTSLLVAVLLGTFLLMAVSQLFFYAKRLYVQTRNINSLYSNAGEAITFLSKNVRVAGNGVVNPNPKNDFTVTPDAVSYGAHDLPAPTWMYIGYFYDSTSKFNQKLMDNVVTTPNLCSRSADAQISPSLFLGLRNWQQCWVTSGIFDKAIFENEPTPDWTLTPCGAPNAPNSPYNCGSSNYSYSVYQKLMQHAFVKKGAGYNQSDVLTIRFLNPTSAKGGIGFSTFSGASLSAAGMGVVPPIAGEYVFSIANVNNVPTLQAKDSIWNLTLDIVKNVEYMSVLLGESDIDTRINNYYLIPGVNRYIEGSNINFIDYPRIISIRIAIVVRTDDEIQQTPTGPMQIMQGDNGNWITYSPPSDLRMRRLFVITIPLLGYRPPGYEKHCVFGPGGYYVKKNGMRLQNFTGSDECCKTSANGGCQVSKTMAECVKSSVTVPCW